MAEVFIKLKDVMASQFYNRYIPNVPMDVHVEKTFRPAKKRKKSKSKHTASEEQILSSPNPATEDNASKSSSSKAGSSVRGKYNSTWSKFEKASRKSAQPREVIANGINEHEEAHRTPSGFQNGNLATEIPEPEAEKDPETALEFHGLEPLPQPDAAETLPPVSAFSAIPNWVKIPVTVPSTATVPLGDLPIDKQMLSSLQDNGYSTAFAIQSAVLPMLLPGPHHYSGDLCISAATGSGKTLAYALPMTEAFRGKAVTSLQGLIVVPTRELVNQIKQVLDVCISGSGLKIGTAVGSKSLKEEQALLIHKGQRYDPEGYKAKQAKEVDDDEVLMDWNLDNVCMLQDDLEVFYNHVVEYTSMVDILICTPGRLVEHIKSTAGFTLQHVHWLVIDEADRLLDESFQQWMEIVLPGLEHIPPPDPMQDWMATTFHLRRQREVRKIILSATMTRDVGKLAALKLRRPRLIVLEGQSIHDETQNAADVVDIQDEERIQLPNSLQETAIKVPDSNDKPLYLAQVIEFSMYPKLNDQISRDRRPNNTDEASPSNELMSSDPSHNPSPSPSLGPKGSTISSTTPPSTANGTLVFTRTNSHATRLARLLALLRPSWSQQISTLTKSTSSSKSLKTLRSFRQGKISILIASDRASRGLDIPDLAHVINYDMPTSVTAYVHRVGRTARAGKGGTATTLIEENEARWFWNDIAKGKGIGRGKARKVVRDNTKYEFGDEVRRQYEEALEVVGREAKG